MTNKLTKTINVIFFGSDYLIKSNDEMTTIDQVIKNKSSVLFLHESFKTKNQQNKIIQLRFTFNFSLLSTMVQSKINTRKINIGLYVFLFRDVFS